MTPHERAMIRKAIHDQQKRIKALDDRIARGIGAMPCRHKIEVSDDELRIRWREKKRRQRRNKAAQHELENYQASLDRQRKKVEQHAK